MKIKSMLLGALALVCSCAFGEETKVLVGVKGGPHGAAARKLQTCGFLLNKDFKENAKYYLCLFSASWCGPCRREMPRIAKTYVETLKDDPNVELIHFSRDQNDDKALAWAKEHDVKFPVVKPTGGNPLDLHSRGIPHLFIVDADGKLLEEGHPAKLFTNEKLNALKAGKLTAPETATEKTRKAIAKLFPGWSLDTEVCDHDFVGIQPLIRGKRNVTFVHPKNRETPSVISRTVKLSGNNPCLSLCVASWNDDADFQLSVRVNGMDALTNRIVCTTDAAPWEDIVVPLSAWRGSTAKIEVVFTAYGRYWCEFPCLARVDIIEVDGDMSIKEGKCEVGGYTWSYRAQNGEATIVAENEGWFSTAVSPCPVGNLTIPATIAGAKVTHIGRDAFLDCSALTSVTIPEGVSRIGREAFRDCTGLKSIKIPSSVKIIERDAFMGCVALSSVSIPEGVTIIDRGAFIRCYGLESIEIPSSVTQIGRDAFCNCGKLTSVTIPEKVTDIGYGAFHGCNALTSVTIPASVTNINLVAFRNTGALTSFHVAPGNRFYKSENGLLLTKDGTTLVRGVNGDATIPPSVTAIGGCAFEGCVALRSAEIPSGVKSIGPFAFTQCRGMKSVTIPSSVMDIGREAFSNCKGLKSIAIPQGVTAIRNSTFSRSALTEVTIPANVKVLERGAFSWCGELKSVTFHEGMTIIGRDAFYNCGKLTSLIIPSSVQRIEQGAFHGCGSLTSVTMRGERPNAPNNIFERCGKLKSIHVPAKAKSWAGMKEWQGIPLVFDGEDAGRQAQAEHGAAPKGDLARPRLRRMEAERQAAESAQRQTAAEREQQRKALLQIQKELRRQREARQAEKEAGASGIQTEKFPLALGIELEMIKCPAGEFMMGYESWKTWASSQNRQLRKLHRVKLTKDFMLGKFPVTCSQWYAIMGNGKKAPKGLENTPAGNITVPEMQAFCDKLTAKFKAQLGGKVFRLPTDAEWEYASKGGKNLDGMLGKTLGFNGNTGSSSRDGKEVEAIFRQMGYTAEDHARASDTNKPFFMWNPLAVGKYKPNEWGFMDLTGNAWEVTADTIMDTVLSKEGGISSFIHVWNGRQIYSDFEIDPLLKGERHLVRTGFWEKGIAHGIGNKMGIGDNDRFPAVGFRVCIGEPLGDWNNAFSLNAAPGSVTELNLGNVPPLQFVYCPAGKFSMGYKEQPALSKVKDIEISSPFWVSKTPLRVDQLASLGLNSITDTRIGAAGIDDVSIVIQKLPSVLKERFGKMLPPGYVFRLPTEAEFEYLQKAETKDKNAQTNIWGVERLYSGGIIALLDRAPAYGKGVDVVNDASNGTVWTVLVKVNYENQPNKDPVGWSDDPNWCVFRRRLARNCNGGKLMTIQRTNNLSGFYFVVAPDVDKLNKFYWK